MRFLRHLLIILAQLICPPVWGQQTQQTTALPPAQQDPQAINVLSQALGVAGGSSSISAIQDYTASGTVTYHWGGNDVVGTVTLSGRGLDQFRMDSYLPNGVRSWAASRGNASEKAEDGTISQVRGFSLLSPSSLIFPYSQLATALKQTGHFSSSYQGLVSVDGHSAYDICVRRVIINGYTKETWASEIGALDFFIDASTFQILMTRDMARPSRNSAEGPPHEVRFSDYRIVNGISIPFSITESIAGQQTSIIHLDTMTFNSALADSNFQF